MGRLCVCEAFTVSNRVRQGGVLSPFLFSVYMDDLSDKLDNTAADCFIGNFSSKDMYTRPVHILTFFDFDMASQCF